MMKEYIKGIMLLSLFALFLNSCSNDDDDDSIKVLPSGTQVSITPSIDIDKNDINFKTDFEVYDAIGIFAVERTSVNKQVYPAAQGNFVQNAKWVYKEGVFVPATASDAIVTNGKVIDIYAYFPYYNDVSDATQIPVYIVENNVPNVLTARASITDSKDIKLAFKHKFAVVEAHVTGDGAGAVPFTNSSYPMKARMYFARTNGSSINLSKENQIEELQLKHGEKDYLQMSRYTITQSTTYTDFLYQGIVPAQQFFKDQRLFRFTQGGVDMDYYSDKDFEASATTRIEVKLNVKQDANHVYNVGDIYPYTGFPTGVVFEITDGGKHGKAASFDVSSNSYAAWGSPAESSVIKADDREDGLRNMGIMTAIKDWRKLYPAAQWCAAKGDGWYFPAVEEVNSLLSVYKKNENLFDKRALTATGFTFLRKGGTYKLSSTESIEENTTAEGVVQRSKVVTTMGTSESTANKSRNGNTVIAIRKF